MAGECPDNLVTPLDLVCVGDAVDDLGMYEVDVFLFEDVLDLCHAQWKTTKGE